MPLTKPTVRELTAQTEAHLASRLGVGALFPRSVLYVLARVMAGSTYHLFARLEWVWRQLWEDTADGAELERRASICGIYRKPASAAEITVTFTGTAASIASGVRVRRVDGVEFVTTEAGTFVLGATTVAATAAEAGAAANSNIATPLTLTSPILNVNTAAVVASLETSGADREDDEALRARVLQRKRNPPHGGAPADYIAWALEVPGVTRVWVQRAYPEPGSVGVTFVLDNDPSDIIPSPSKVAEVQAYIDPRAPATAFPIVYAPGTVAVDVEIALTVDTQAIRDAVESSLGEFFTRSADAGGSTVYLSQIREAISTAAGEVDHTLVDPVADTTVPVGSIATLGTVTFS